MTAIRNELLRQWAEALDLVGWSILPGTAKSGLPWSPARPAVIMAPPAAPLSTNSKP